jgi:hypothetical protein
MVMNSENSVHVAAGRSLQSTLAPRRAISAWLSKGR